VEEIIWWLRASKKEYAGDYLIKATNQENIIFFGEIVINDYWTYTEATLEEINSNTPQYILDSLNPPVGINIQFEEVSTQISRVAAINWAEKLEWQIDCGNYVNYVSGTTKNIWDLKILKINRCA